MRWKKLVNFSLYSNSQKPPFNKSKKLKMNPDFKSLFPANFIKANVSHSFLSKKYDIFNSNRHSHASLTIPRQSKLRPDQFIWEDFSKLPMQAYKKYKKENENKGNSKTFSKSAFIAKENLNISFSTLLWGMSGLLVIGLLAGNTTVYAEENNKELDENEILIDIVIKGDLEALKKLLKKENYAEISDEDNNTLLLIAAKHGHLKIVQWLLKEKIAFVKEKNNEGITALLAACNEGHKELAIWLLTNGGSNIKEKDRKNCTVLIKSINGGNKKLVEWLVKHGASVREKNKRGETALLYAAARGYKEIFQFLLTQGADITEKSNDGETSLTVAALYGHKEMVEFLINKYNIDFKEKNYDGNTAFLQAAEQGYLDVVNFLLDKGADIHEKNKRNETALLMAARGENKNGRYPELVQVLTQKGADLKDRDDSGCTSLLHAASGKCLSLVEILIQQGADVNESDKDGTTALHYAVLNNDPELVRFLLAHGAKKVKDIYDRTPIDIIIEHAYEVYEKIKDKSIKIPNFKNQSEIEKRYSISGMLLKHWDNNLENTEASLKKLKIKLESDKLKDTQSVVETFRKNLSEKLNVILYTDKAIWDGTARAMPGNFDKFLEVAQIVSAASGDMPVRIAANLVKIYAEKNLEEYRKNKAAYIQIFDGRSISEITREAAKLIGERYKEQLWELSAEGLDDFSQYFCDKLIQALRTRYKVSVISETVKTTPIVREMFDIMIDPNKGRSVPLELRGRDRKETNRDKEENWDSRELINNVGTIVKRKYIETDIIIKCPKSADEFKKQLDNWKKRCEVGNILFMRNPNNNIWKAYLVKNQEKELEEKTVELNSDFGDELKKVEQVNVLSYDTSSLQSLLKKHKLFDHNTPNTLYVLKSIDKKYGACYGDKYDVLNPKFNHCSYGIFGCRPHKISELEEYNNNNDPQIRSTLTP